MDLEEMSAYFKEMGQPAFRAKQVFQWLHRGVTSFDEMSKSSRSITENMLYDYIVDWKKRLGNPEDESRIRELAKYLTLNGFIGIDYSCDYKDSAY